MEARLTDRMDRVSVDTAATMATGIRQVKSLMGRVQSTAKANHTALPHRLVEHTVNVSPLNYNRKSRHKK